MTTKEHSNGATASYYQLPDDATEIQHLISHRNMNAQIGEIFRACYRYGLCAHSDQLRDARKIAFYAKAEVERLEKAALIAGYTAEYEDRITQKPADIPCSTLTWHAGDKDACVETIQNALNKWVAGHIDPVISRLEVDGDFGTKTAERVELFQIRHRLKVDGVVGPWTWDALEPYI